VLEVNVSKFSRKSSRRCVASLFATTLLLSASPIAADEYDPLDAGHPIRIIAYAVHPIGVMLDLLIFRPAHWIGSYEPIALFFGHERYTH
jgi:hypothetical protein